MKKLIIILLILFPLFIYSQTHSCCTTTSGTQQFAMIFADEKFAAAHMEPLPLHFVAERGGMITFDCPDNKKANAFFIQSTIASSEWLFVFHEWWGLNDYIKRESEKLAAELGNVNILAIDYYDGEVTDKREEAQKLAGNLKDERAKNIILGALQYSGSNARIMTIGWCMGGGLALQAAILAGNRGQACVMYYGMPEKDKAKLSTLNADVLGIFASKDQWINAEVVSEFEKNMNAAGKNVTIKSYDADHAFANPSNPVYDKAAAEEAHKLSIAFLKKHMK
jgi:carboxymethylenebutenolidase